MLTEKKLYKYVIDILTEAYSVSVPIGNLTDMMARGETRKKDWYMAYYCNDAILKSIVEGYCKRHRLDRISRDSVFYNVYLGAAPNGCLETWKKAYGKKLKAEAKKNGPKKNVL